MGQFWSNLAGNLAGFLGPSSLENSASRGWTENSICLPVARSHHEFDVRISQMFLIQTHNKLSTQIWSGCWSLGLLTRKWCCTLVQQKTVDDRKLDKNHLLGIFQQYDMTSWEDILFSRVFWSDLRFGFLHFWDFEHARFKHFCFFLLQFYFKVQLWLCANVLFKSEYSTHL